MTVDGPEYCDIVMKGGITSGIVYPNAVTALATKYRFKNIGGTSAGAIAAAAAAAAALGERRKELENGWVSSPGTGFDGLSGVAKKLKTEGFIFSLFQPARGAEAVYNLINTFTTKPGPIAIARALIVAVVRIAPGTVLLSAIVLLGGAWLIGGSHGLIAAFVPALACVLGVSFGRVLVKSARILRQNHFGLCSGLTIRRDGKHSDAGLTDWLHGVLQSLAGKSQDQPLTFQDLWGAPRYPGEPKTEKALQLAMISTDVSHHEPRTLPFEKARFWYCEDDFRRLFPKCLVDAIADQAPLILGGKTYHRLPSGGSLPVLIATRMSLSFPLLISAVPLYEADYGATVAESENPAVPAEVAPGTEEAVEMATELAAGGRQGKVLPPAVRVCWFSDGGIGSNFPIHLFDSPLPRWPTFAIDLTYPNPGESPVKNDVFLPTANNEGWRPVYSSFRSASSLGEIAGFLFAIIATMQNWRDLLQSRAPGYRDRIVHIALAGDEGGLNLNMPQAVLDRIAAKGTLAGQTLATNFRFGNHWWIRWRNVASTIEGFLGEFAKGAGQPIGSSYTDAYESATTGQPDPPSYKFTAEQKAEAQQRFKLLREQGEEWRDRDPDLTKGAPNPPPQLRIMPTF